MSESNSPRGILNSIDFKKIGIGALMAVIGSLITYFVKVVADIDWGPWAAVVQPLASIFANAIRKWIANYNK